MKKSIAFSAVCLILLAQLALAAPADKQAVFTTDLKHVMAAEVPPPMVPAPEDAALSVIAGNFSRYPLATYFSVFGNTIAQGGSNFPFQVWEAMPFTPKSNATVTKIEVSAGRQGGGTAGFEVGLYSDDNGVPGTQIASAHLSNLPIYGQCCAVATVSDPAGISLSAGTQYWVVVYTNSNDTDIYAWAFNSTNMTATLAAEWCLGSQTYCGSNSGKWIPYQYVQLGFQVLGH
jgi:hypothetical protein